MPDALIARDSAGRVRKLVRVGHVDEMGEEGIQSLRGLGQGVAEDDDDDVFVGAARSGALVRVEHTLDPEAQETLRSLRRGAPVAAAVGGAVAGAALLGLALWLLSDDGESADEDEDEEEEE